MRPVCQLPCLENLTLTDNSVTMTVDYRTRILEMFGDRVSEVRLGDSGDYGVVSGGERQVPRAGR